jgi:large subunit ribosomal protein L21
MYAVVDIAGKQFKVAKDQYVYAPSLEGESGASVEFDRVLLIEGDAGVDVGTPIVSGAKVTGKILDHGRNDKVIVFKKKRRKGYKKTQGHRQGFTKVLIEDILVSGQDPAATKEENPKKEAKQEASPDTQDDLTKVKGIGKMYAEELNKLGYTTFQQLSKLTDDDMTRIAEAIDGITVETIQNDNWITQAEKLVK